MFKENNGSGVPHNAVDDHANEVVTTDAFIFSRATKVVL